MLTLVLTVNVDDHNKTSVSYVFYYTDVKNIDLQIKKT